MQSSSISKSGCAGAVAGGAAVTAVATSTSIGAGLTASVSTAGSAILGAVTAGSTAGEAYVAIHGIGWVLTSVGAIATKVTIAVSTTTSLIASAPVILPGLAVCAVGGGIVYGCYCLGDSLTADPLQQVANQAQQANNDAQQVRQQIQEEMKEVEKDSEQVNKLHSVANKLKTVVEGAGTHVKLAHDASEKLGAETRSTKAAFEKLYNTIEEQATNFKEQLEGRRLLVLSLENARKENQYSKEKCGMLYEMAIKYLNTCIEYTIISGDQELQQRFETELGILKEARRKDGY